MLGLPPFQYASPDTVDAAVALLTLPGVRVLAGGTDLLPSMKHRLFQPTTLVSLRRLSSLLAIESVDGGLVIGARCSLQQLRRDPVVLARYPALAAACATVATTTIQAMATIGGNVMLDTRCAFYNQPDGWRDAIGGCLKCDGEVCHVARTGDGCYAAHSADTVPVLWLMGAKIELVSVRGTRVLPVSELYDGADGRRWLRSAPDELLTRIILPPPGAPIAHYKVRLRGAIDYGAVLVAAQRAGDGARAVLSAIGPAPVEARAAMAADLPDVAHALARPLPTHLVDTGWRRHMVRVAVRRALAQLD